MKKIFKYLFLGNVGGVVYLCVEYLYRGYSHWTMYLLAFCAFIFLGLINKLIPWEMPLYKQVLLGDIIVTILEFITGYIVNIKFGWEVWDYSHLPGNIMGQICPLFCVLWLPLCLTGIVLDDWLRYWIFNEERPHYTLF